MKIRKLRLQRSWSQEQLAQMCGLNVRTIQRIERGHNAGLETLKALAAVFEVPIQELQPEATAMTDTNRNHEEQEAIEHVKELKDFYTHLITYATFITFLFFLNLLSNPDQMWVWKVAAGWGIGVAFHALSMLESIHLFSPQWEKKRIEKRLGRKL